jgi:DNA invertase Pin-like site-specific DNA recombinase
MVSEQERNESKRRQAQGIQVAKEKGVYKGRPLLYSPNAKDPQKRIIYHRVVEMLEEGKQLVRLRKKLISQDRQFIELSMIRDHLDKWVVNANKRLSQSLKTHIILLK